MSSNNHVQMFFDAKSVNEGFARMTVAAFMMELNPTLQALDDVKTAVSEAVTNAIVHGYEGQEGRVELSCSSNGQELTVIVADRGVGIEDVRQARIPFYTSKPEQERSGMGFAFMEAFMDQVDVESAPGEGTTVTMRKYIQGENA